jgi:hypothetical protein
VRVPNLFHVVRLRFARRRCAPPRATTYPWASLPPLYGIRRVRRAAEYLTTTAWARLLARTEAGDEAGQVAAAWVAAQELRAICRCRDRDHAAQRLYDWTVTCIDSGVLEIGRLARTITTWRAEFLAYFSVGRISDGPT